MSSVVTGQVGPAFLTDGVQTAPLRQGRSGETVVTEAHGKYYEATYRGNVFWATMTAGVIFPAPGATANNPITLSNPVGSGKNLVLIGFDMVATIIPGTPLTGLYGLFINNNPIAAAPTGTALAPVNGLLGLGVTSVAKPLTTSTVPVAPTLLKPFAQKVTGEVVTAAPSPGFPSFHLDLDGTIILAPGTSITPQQTVADTTNATVICGFTWEEVTL